MGSTEGLSSAIESGWGEAGEIVLRFIFIAGFTNRSGSVKNCNKKMIEIPRHSVYPDQDS
jgi:hypothetical protein